MEQYIQLLAMYIQSQEGVDMDQAVQQAVEVFKVAQQQGKIEELVSFIEKELVPLFPEEAQGMRDSPDEDIRFMDDDVDLEGTGGDVGEPVVAQEAPVGGGVEAAPVAEAPVEEENLPVAKKGGYYTGKGAGDVDGYYATKAVQSYLNDKGYYGTKPLAVDGVLGSHTRSAINKYGKGLGSLMDDVGIYSKHGDRDRVTRYLNKMMYGGIGGSKNKSYYDYAKSKKK